MHCILLYFVLYVIVCCMVCCLFMTHTLRPKTDKGFYLTSNKRETNNNHLYMILDQEYCYKRTIHRLRIFNHCKYTHQVQRECVRDRKRT